MIVKEMVVMVVVNVDKVWDACGVGKALLVLDLVGG